MLLIHLTPKFGAKRKKKENHKDLKGELKRIWNLRRVIKRSALGIAPIGLENWFEPVLATRPPEP